MDEPVAESSPEPSDSEDDGDADDETGDDAVRLGDDVWTGAASEDSVPTREPVDGVRTEHEESRRRRRVRSIRRRRRQ